MSSTIARTTWQSPNNEGEYTGTNADDIVDSSGNNIVDPSGNQLVSTAVAFTPIASTPWEQASDSGHAIEDETGDPILDETGEPIEDESDIVTPATLWRLQSGAGEYAQATVNNIVDSSGNQLVDPSGDDIVDTGVSLTTTPDTGWEADESA